MNRFLKVMYVTLQYYISIVNVLNYEEIRIDIANCILILFYDAVSD